MRDALFVLALALALQACGSSSSGEYSSTHGGQASSPDDLSSFDRGVSDYASEGHREFDEDAARDAAADEVASEGYIGIGTPYGCTEDCSGHDAGFEWAADNGDTDSWGCGGSSSRSFDEGCASYGEAIEERVDDMRSEFEDGDDTYAE